MINFLFLILLIFNIVSSIQFKMIIAIVLIWKFLIMIHFRISYGFLFNLLIIKLFIYFLLLIILLFIYFKRLYYLRNLVILYFPLVISLTLLFIFPNLEFKDFSHQFFHLIIIIYFAYVPFPKFSNSHYFIRNHN